MFIEIGKDIVNSDHITTVHVDSYNFKRLQTTWNGKPGLIVEMYIHLCWNTHFGEQYKMYIQSETSATYVENLGQNHLPFIRGPLLPVSSCCTFYDSTEDFPSREEIDKVIQENINTWVRTYIKFYLDNQHYTSQWSFVDDQA